MQHYLQQARSRTVYIMDLSYVRSARLYRLSKPYRNFRA